MLSISRNVSVALRGVVAVISLTAITAFDTQAATAPAAAAPRPRPTVDAYPNLIQKWPNENRAAAVEAMSNARKAAGADLLGYMTRRCVINPEFRLITNGEQFNGILEPTKLFDQLYWVGQNAVSSHALVTSAGIVLFDALNNEDEAKNILVPNLIKVGLKPTDIKYIVINHEHGDHYGGARYLQKTYGAKVIATAQAWETMTKPPSTTGGFAGLVGPDRDITVVDGQKMTIGTTDLTFYHTPGHTPGAVSTLFKVTDNGAPHTVALLGASSTGSGPGGEQQHGASLRRWAGISRAAGADVFVAPHLLHDLGLEKQALLRYRKAGDPNPYVLGVDAQYRVLQTLAYCSDLAIARGRGAAPGD